MPKYALIGGYTSEAWAKIIDNPGDRVAAVSKTAQAVGAKLELFFWSFGDDDYLAIIDAPDDDTAGSFAIAVGSSGSLRNLRTIKLMTQEEGRKVLEKAKAAKVAYAPPGARTPAGVRYEPASTTRGGPARSPLSFLGTVQPRPATDRSTEASGGGRDPATANS